MPLVNTARAEAQGDITLEALTQPFWDTEALDTGSTDVSYFTSPDGKTRRETNLKTSAQFAAPKQYVIKAVRFTLPFGADSADQAIIYNEGVISLIIGDKPYLRLPLTLVTSGCGLDGGIVPADPGNTGTNTVETYLVNGRPSHRNLYTLEWPITVPPMQEIEVMLSFPGGLSTLADGPYDAMFYLEGELGREVQ